MKPNVPAEWGGRMRRRWRWSTWRFEWGRIYYAPNNGGAWWQWENP